MPITINERDKAVKLDDVKAMVDSGRLRRYRMGKDTAILLDNGQAALTGIGNLKDSVILSFNEDLAGNTFEWLLYNPAWEARPPDYKDGIPLYMIKPDPQSPTQMMSILITEPS
jgi:hypothetical protein